MKRLAILCLLVTASATAADAPIRLPRPPFPAPATEPAGGGTSLAIVSSRLSVGDESAWIRRNGLDTRTVPLANAPSGAPARYAGLALIRVIRQQGGFLLIYGRDFASGRVLVALGPTGRVRYAFDFAAFSPSTVSALTYQELVWAAEAGGTLFVESSYNGYARDSNGRNAYVTAIDLGTRKIRWRSPGLVANARRFELVGGVIVTGYGFTDEPDYVYLLSRRTGRALARVRVPTAPELIVRKGSRFSVRTYDHDLVLELVQP